MAKAQLNWHLPCQCPRLPGTGWSPAYLLTLRGRQGRVLWAGRKVATQASSPGAARVYLA